MQQDWINFWGIVLLYLGIVVPLKLGGIIVWSWSLILAPFWMGAISIVVISLVSVYMIEDWT
jgi:hypothetical protein